MFPHFQVHELEAATGPFLLLLFLVPALFTLAIPYAILVLRDVRAEARDPQLGWKAVLFFMLSLSILLALYALTVLAIDALAAEPWNARSPSHLGLSEKQRTAIALLISALVVGVTHLVLILLFSNARRFPAARRIFLGCRLAVHALIVLGALTTLLVEFSRPTVDLDPEAIKPPLCTLLVWGPSWVCHLILLRISSAPQAAPRARALTEQAVGREA